MVSELMFTKAQGCYGQLVLLQSLTDYTELKVHVNNLIALLQIIRYSENFQRNSFIFEAKKEHGHWKGHGES